MAETMFLIYDGRAKGGDTENALVVVTAKTLKEARREAPKHGADCAIYEYDVVGDQLLNERFIE
jgi:hypothetical protein